MISLLVFTILLSTIILLAAFTQQYNLLGLLNLYISSLTLGLAVCLASIGFKHWARDKKREVVLQEVSGLEKKLWYSYGAENVADNKIINGLDKAINDEVSITDPSFDIINKFKVAREMSDEKHFDYTMTKTACFAQLYYESKIDIEDEYGQESISSAFNQIRTKTIDNLLVKLKESRDKEKDEIKRISEEARKQWDKEKLKVVLDEIKIIKKWEKSI